MLANLAHEASMIAKKIFKGFCLFPNKLMQVGVFSGMSFSKEDYKK